MKNLSVLLATVASLLLPQAPAEARDYVLTIGGGYSPAGNQISLERNVVFFRKLLAEKYAGGVPHDLYFSDGDSPNPDLNFEPADHQSPRANLLSALVFGKEDNLKLQYRNNQLDNVNGVSSPENLEKWFVESGAKLQPGDRLILYITAHGGRSGDKKNRQNTKLYMWNGRSIDAKTLAGHLKALPEKVEVMTVMVQCFSGGFASLLFDETDSSKGPGARPVCGFFATVQDRIAAGCTPEINEENYDEFSSHFWAAIRGKTRTDKSVPSADYDGDKRVSFEEAHAYTLLASHSLDIPVKTSGAFLRAHSKTKNKEHPDLLDIDAPYFPLLAKASPVDLAVLDGLSTRLGLTGIDRVKQSRDAAKKLEEERKKAEDERNAGKKQFDDARKKIRTTLKNRWPELENTSSPGALALFTERSPELVKAIEEHTAFKDMMDGRKKRGENEHQRLQIDKQWAHHQRFLRALETLVLAQNLPHVADETVQQQYADLLSRERGSLGEAAVVAEEEPPKEEKPVASAAKGS